MRRLSRRNLLKGTIAGAAAAAAAPAVTVATPVRANGFQSVVDLTHTMWQEFPTFFGKPQLEMEVLNTFSQHGFNMNRWLLVEHTGTHLDAPIHFSADQPDAAEIPAEQLVVPLAVVDIAERAQDDADTQLTPDDLAAWEAEHGELQPGVCVAMHSGWDRFVTTPRFRNADDDGGMHFPGFHVEAAQMLLEREAAGIAVDTLSLDAGQSKDFATHYEWLPQNRWGLEAVANLGELPAWGATIVVGGPKIAGASGGPSRVLALV